MDIQASKIELVKMILNIENPSVVRKIVDLLKSETKDFSLSMTAYEKKEIEKAIHLLDQGKRTSFDDFMKKVS